MIEILERNARYLKENIEVFDQVHERLNHGLGFSEKNNYRVAYMYFREAIKIAGSHDQKMLTQHDNILEALERIKCLVDTVIDPLWEKYCEGKY